jgi:hypothetical protein
MLAELVWYHIGRGTVLEEVDDDPALFAVGVRVVVRAHGDVTLPQRYTSRVVKKLEVCGCLTLKKRIHERGERASAYTRERQRQGSR